jgi:hypothetical protein
MRESDYHSKFVALERRKPLIPTVSKKAETSFIRFGARFSKTALRFE